MRLSAYLPLLLFGACGLYFALTTPKWRDAKYVRKPERVFWGFWHLLDDSEWTDEGLVVQRRILLAMGGALLMGIIGIVLGRILETRGL